MEVKIKELQKLLEVAKEKLESLGYVGDLEEDVMKSSLEKGSYSDGRSLFLEYLPKLRAAGVAGLILEHLVEGEGGAQGILNLRKVHSQTKEWVDTLPQFQSDRIFKRIPIKFTLCIKDLAKFDSCPPPPPATAMIFEIGEEWIPFVYSDKMKPTLLKLKEDYPLFFTFWNSRLKTLDSTTLGCDVNVLVSNSGLDLGTPNALRNLGYHKAVCFHPILSQVETLIIRKFGFFEKDVVDEMNFYRELGGSRNLKRLRIVFNDNYDQKKVEPGRNLLEGIQLLIDVRKNDPNFELVLEFDRFNLKDAVQDEDLRRFVASVAASLSAIRIAVWDWPDIQKIQSLFAGSSKSSEMKILKDFFKSIEGVQWVIVEDDPPVVGLLEGNWLPNLRKTSIRCLIEEEIPGLCNLPGCVEHLGMYGASFFPVAMSNWPERVTVLLIDHSEDSQSQPQPVWTPAEWIARLTLIAENFKLLNQLTLDYVNFSEEALRNWESPQGENLPDYSFKKLKSFQLGFHSRMSENHEGAGGRMIVATRKLLLHIFQVQRMQLLKFTVPCNWGKYQMELDSECVSALVKSPLGKSLVSTDLEAYISEDARESREQFLSVVQKNRRQREEKFGRQGRRLKFFDFSMPKML